jgi:hypothetical protein
MFLKLWQVLDHSYDAWLPQSMIQRASHASKPLPRLAHGLSASKIFPQEYLNPLCKLFGPDLASWDAKNRRWPLIKEMTEKGYQ